ncbi:MAG: hypothetical protein JXD18_04620 [Anaerolineae bacterium]|nr:hypothetical protein [Anaerolineae bacterium]
MQRAIRREPVQILTHALQIAGELEVVGPPLIFLNEDDRDDLVMRDVRVAPLMPSGSFKSLSRPQITIRKKDLLFVYFTDPETRAKVNLLAHEEDMVVYTPHAILRGSFHLPVEIIPTSFLSTIENDLLPFSKAQLFWLRPLPMSFPDRCDLLFIGEQHIQMYHSGT